MRASEHQRKSDGQDLRGNRNQKAPGVVHVLKCWPEFFGPLLTGQKTFEVRKNDRDFRVGDVLHLREWDAGDPGQGFGYTGRETQRKVTYVLSGMGIEPQYVCLGLADEASSPPRVPLSDEG